MRTMEYKVDNFEGYTISNDLTEDGSITWPPIKVLSFSGVEDELIKTSEGDISPICALAGKTKYALISLDVNDYRIGFNFAHRATGEKLYFYICCQIEGVEIDLEVKRINDNESDRYRIDSAPTLIFTDPDTGREEYDYEPRVTEWHGVDNRSLCHRLIAWLSRRTVCDTASNVRSVVIKKNIGYEYPCSAIITEIRR